MTPRTRPLYARAAWVALALLSAACADIETTRDPAADFSSYRTWAWSPAGAPAVTAAEPANDERVRLRVEAAVERELAARGLRKVPTAEADLLVTQTATVESKLQQNDPYYSLYVAEKYDEGTLELTFVDARTKREVWQASISDRLRYSARAVGLNDPRFVSTGEERVWRTDEMVGALMARFPRAN